MMPVLLTIYDGLHMPFILRDSRNWMVPTLALAQVEED